MQLTWTSTNLRTMPAYDAPLVAAAKAAHSQIRRLADDAALEFAANANDAELLRAADDLQREADEAWEDITSAEQEAGHEALRDDEKNVRPAPHITGGAFEVPQQTFPPCTIVRNIIDHFFRYRGLTLASHGLSPDKTVPDFQWSAFNSLGSTRKGKRREESAIG